jgi:hypothetical protein
MATLLDIEGDAPAYPERVAVFSTVETDEPVEAIKDRIVDSAKTVADEGPVRVDAEYDHATGRVKVSAAGTLSSLRLLEQLFVPPTAMSTILQIEPIERAFADSLAAHFLAAAKHHPQGGVPLNFDSDYDAPRRFMRVTFSGSVFAIAYFATLLELRLTQRQDREKRHAS